MSELKIAGWAHFDDSYPTINNPDLIKDAITLIQNEIKENGYCFSGEDHQNKSNCMPVFSNGTCMRFSMRLWGTLMASVYSTPDNQVSYMDFYMSVSKPKFPKSTQIRVLPAKGPNVPGYTSRQDQELLAQSAQFGMPLITTDKVLKALENSPYNN